MNKINEWKTTKLCDVINFNPPERLPKGTVAKKVAMGNVQAFFRDIYGYEVEPYNGGAKFRNGDTIMARITPCLENGKSAYISFLDDEEIGYGSTEFIVWRAREGITDNEYIYYLSQSPEIRDVAVKSMVGTSGRQRVQQGVLDNYEIDLPSLETQRTIAATLSALDDKIAVNNKVNRNLEEMTQTAFEEIIIKQCAREPLYVLSDIAEFNPKRTLIKGQEATYIEMANLPTSGSFPMDWTSRSFSGGMKFANGDTVMARITPCLENGKTAYINFLDDDEVAFGSTEYIVITPKEGYCNEMFYFLARYPDFISFAVRNMNGTSGRQRVSSEVIGLYEMNAPTEKAVNDFSQMATPVMKTIKINSIENRILAKLRNSLLPRLMSGEIEV